MFVIYSLQLLDDSEAGKKKENNLEPDRSDTESFKSSEDGKIIMNFMINFNLIFI
jgi:hypothetical protein